ncbi:MAG TPA: AraC family transcriptional regulator [Pyrinomonadaceae bacterium]|nr:AraC family transcriptional regulator [Pyrinomonadaceae bacterium]
MELRIQESPFRAHIIKTCEFAGLRLVDGVYSAKTKVPRHSHQHAVFCVALNGMCSEVFAGKVRQYEASTVEFLPPDQCHSLDFPFADTRAFSINIDTCWIERAREFSLRLDNSVHAHGGLLSGLMMKIYDEFRHLDGASPVAIQGLAMEMFAAVSRNHSNLSVRQPQRWLARAVEFLRESFTEHLTLAQVASAAGVHPVYLAREFRRFHGCTIGEYIRRLRIERACGQLSSSDESLATIAADGGFSDQSHFSRTFKRLVGMTPAQYRANFDRH